MADEEAERDHSPQIGTSAAIVALRERLQTLATELRDSREPAVQSAAQYCQDFCQTLVEYAGRWKISEDPLPLVEVYMVAILSYAQARHYLTSECENVSLVLERLTLSCVELLLSLPEEIPNALWQEFQLSVQKAHSLLLDSGNCELHMLSSIAKERGVWANDTLQSILSKETPEVEKVREFLEQEGAVLLDMRVKHLIKENHIEKAALVAKVCSEHPEFGAKSSFKQTYLVCLCSVAPREQVMQEISEVDCKDALEMICNLESEGDEKGALSLCSAFLTRQLLQGDMYCAWELTLFWSKLLQRLEPSTQVFLDHCRQMSLLSKTVYHIFFLIKVIQSEVQDVGLPVCIELCVRALRLETGDNTNIKATICKTISCLLPNDLEVKRACQLTEFLLEPTVDSYYAVETLYNEPDQKFEEENLPVPNSLRCELLLVFKTQWPFDPEFWDWKTLKRHCLALMGEEASIVSSIDELNDCEVLDQLEDEDGSKGHEEFKDLTDCFLDTTHVLNEIVDEKQKKREIKKLREKGFISARFRNWQAYMQYCVLCDKEFLGHRIVRHAQKHVKDGVYSCPICAESFDCKELFVPHVTSHVKQSCKERLAAMKTSRKLGSPTKMPFPNCVPQKVKTNEMQDSKPKKKSRPCSNDAEVSKNSYSQETVKTKLPKPDLALYRAEYTEEYTCPVTNCRKGFKYFKNLIAHVKAHKNNEEAKRFLEMQSKKVVCQYCRRQFVSVTHLNDHLQMHCGAKPYICIQLNCKSSFLSNAELLVHRKEHTAFKAKCMFPNCGRIFYEAYMLYDHEAQHYNTFTCKLPNCGKIFHSQAQLDVHQEDHVTKQEAPNTEELIPLPDLNTTEVPASDQSYLEEESQAMSLDPNSPKMSDTFQNASVESSSFKLPDETLQPGIRQIKIENTIQNIQDFSQALMSDSSQTLSKEANEANTEHLNVTPVPNLHTSILETSIPNDLPDPSRNVLEDLTHTLLPDPDQSLSQNPSQLSDPYQAMIHDPQPAPLPARQSLIQNLSLLPPQKILQDSSETALPPPQPVVLQDANKCLLHHQDSLPNQTPNWFHLNQSPDATQTPLLHPNIYPLELSLLEAKTKEEPVCSSSCTENSTPYFQQALPINEACDNGRIAVNSDHKELEPLEQPELLLKSGSNEIDESTQDTLSSSLQQIPNNVSTVKTEILDEMTVPRPLSVTPEATVPNTSSLPAAAIGRINAIPPSVYQSSVLKAEGEKQASIEGPVKVVQRFNCTFETCTRNYSSTRSVSKHMKAAHPEYYAELKLARKNKKVVRTPIKNVSSDGKLVFLIPSAKKGKIPISQINTTNTMLPFTSTVANPAFTSLAANITSQVLPTQIENIINPIMLSHLGNPQNQSIPLQSKIEANPLLLAQNESTPNLTLQTESPAKLLPLHLQVLASQLSSQMNKTTLDVLTQVCVTNQAAVTRSNTVTPLPNAQASCSINPTLISQPSSAVVPQLHNRGGQVLDSPPDGNVEPTVMPQLSASSDSLLTPQLVESTNSVLATRNETDRVDVQTRNAEKACPHLPLNHGSNPTAPTSCESSHLHYSSNLINDINSNESPQVGNMAKIAVPQVNSSNPNLPSNVEELTKPLLPSAMENISHSLLPSYLESLKVPSVLSGQLEPPVNPLLLPQIESNSLPPFSSPVEGVANPPVQGSIDSVFPSQGNNTMQARANVIQHRLPSVAKSEDETLKVKRTKHNKRAKWPAIVKDGKFICSRCFREFPSPKSLGGHLSKRSHCVPFEETGMTPEFQQNAIPPSFLADLILNQQLSANLNPSISLKDQSSQSLEPSEHTERRFFPNVIFPQANGAACDSNEVQQNNEILKQSIETATIPNLFEPSGISQQTFQNPCGTFQSDGRLPESTVIQHTGKIHVKTENDSSGEDMPKGGELGFCNDIFSDPLLSQMLTDNNSQLSLNNLSLVTNHLNQILRAESLLMKSKGNEDPQVNTGSLQQNILPNDGLLAAMASLTQNLLSNPLLQVAPAIPQQPLKVQQDQPNDATQKKRNVKKKLRAQILAADLLKSGKTGNLLETLDPVANSSLQQNSELQNYPGVQPSVERTQSSELSEVIQTASTSEQKIKTNSDGVAVNDVSVALMSNSLPGVESPPVPGVSLPREVSTNNQDPGCGIEKDDEKIMEIQRAFERLNLNKESNEDSHAANAVTLNNHVDAPKPVIVTKEVQSVETLIKPFVCESEGCSYSAMTKDALFKHYSKVHNYTEDMMNEIRKNQLKFAPFRCQICNKTFTRNSNLRAHCQTVHCLSQEDMIRMKIKRPYSRKSEKPPPGLLCNSGVTAHKNNPLCVENVPDLSQVKANESAKQVCLSLEFKKEPSEVSTVQNTFPIEENVTVKKPEYTLSSFEGNSASSQAIRELSEDNQLSHPVQPTPEIPVARQTAEVQSPLALPVTGPLVEAQAPVLLPGAEQSSEGQLAVGLAVAGQPVVSSLPAGASVAQQPVAGFLAAGQAALGLFSAAGCVPDTLKKPKVSKPKVEKPQTEKLRKTKPKERKEKKAVAKDDETVCSYSPYRPYRCVHQGCFAAFTIQQNLILHYRAVHQSELPRFDNDNEEESDEVRDEVEEEEHQIKEFRCQVKDCSRIFPEVTSLLQHYLHLHKFSLDEAGALMSNMNLGRFQCDQANCTASFTAFWKYISHIQGDHENKVLKSEGAEGLFKCDCEGCDRVYATRSNLLRHLLKKHREYHRAHLIRPRKKYSQETGSKIKHFNKKSKSAGVKLNGKENVQNNKKPKFKRNDKRKRSSSKRAFWTKFERPTLKTNEEALAMCTKKFPLQFPCMIKGCFSVVSSERNIFRHYTTHSLTDRYIEERRGDFILCKKRSHHRYKAKSTKRDRETEKSEGTMTETSDNEDTAETCPEGSETESSKAISCKDEADENTELSDAKQSTDESSGVKPTRKRKARRKWALTVSNVLVKSKRGRPLKKRPKECTQNKEKKNEEGLKPKLHDEGSNACNCSESTTSTAGPPAQPQQPQQNIALSTFKPMGFEVSFLKFLEESSRAPKRKAKENHPDDIASKQPRTLQQKTENIICKTSETHIRTRDCQNLIDFRNPLNLTSVKNVKIVVDKTFSDGADLLLKQLQEMRPIVILKKWLYS